MKILVYGLGRSGLATLRLLTRQGHSAEFMDARSDGPDITAAEQLGAVRLTDAAATTASLVIAAPGVPIDHPDLLALRARGLEVTGEVSWVQRTFTADMIGITGTAGKGTVTAWLTHVLQAASLSAVAGGNIDPALADVARNDALLVTELSSFQLERSTDLDPRVAVILNLAEDHLDRHGTVENYHAAKRNLLSGLAADHLFVYNADDPLLQQWQAERNGRSAGFSTRRPAEAWLAGGLLMLHGEPLIPALQVSLQGEHNLANALAVALAASELGLSNSEIAAGLGSFAGLPGRFSTVLEAGGVTFIEDSIATRPLAVRAALLASRAPVIWLAGGQNKGADITAFREIAGERVSLFIGFGASGAEFCEGLADVVPVLHVPESDGRRAIRQALRLALQHFSGNSGRSATVLLAPLAASFDQFSDYTDRARVFREEVREVAASWTLSS